MLEPTQHRRGPLRLWPDLHPCPICESDRDALGHYVSELGVQLSMEDLVHHLGSCDVDDVVPFADEACEPF